MINKDLETIIAKYAKGTDTKLEIIMEDIRILKERTGSIEERTGSIEEKVDVIFDQVGTLTEDMTVVKHTLQQHERKISR